MQSPMILCYSPQLQRGFPVALGLELFQLGQLPQKPLNLLLCFCLNQFTAQSKVVITAKPGETFSSSFHPLKDEVTAVCGGRYGKVKSNFKSPQMAALVNFRGTCSQCPLCSVSPTLPGGFLGCPAVWAGLISHTGTAHVCGNVENRSWQNKRTM